MQLLVSGQHRYAGRPVAVDRPSPDETVRAVRVRAGLGIVGDRYFNRPAHRDASITLIAAEALDAVAAELRIPAIDLVPTRRNVLLRGVAIDGPGGRVLRLDCGEGAVLLRLRRPARPCGWLDAAIAPGAWTAMRGRGGMRCEPLSDGVLRVGPVQASWIETAAVDGAGTGTAMGPR